MNAESIAKKEFLEYLQSSKSRYLDLFRDYINNIKKAESATELMKLKQKLLLDYILLLPFEKPYHCFLCAKETNPCSNCKYGKHHGICGEVDSDILYIRNVRNDFLDLIENVYYKGEEYLTKLDKSGLKLLITSSEQRLQDVDIIFTAEMRNISDSKDIASIYYHHLRLILNLILFLPLYATDCYFCLTPQPCKDCEYGKYHRICSSLLSDFRKIKKYKNKLYKTVFKKFYYGERYDE